MVRTLSKVLVGLIVGSPLFAFAPQDGPVEDVVRKTVLEKVLKDYSFLRESDVAFRLLNPEEFGPYPKNVSRFDFDLSGISSPLGKTYIPITFYDAKGMLVRRSNLGFEVKASTYALQAARELKRGHILSRADVVSVYVDMQGLNPQRIGTIDEAIGREVLYPIAKGTTLTAQQLRRSPTIRRGDMISLVIREKGLELKVRGEALADGYKGDTIRVKTLLEKRKIVEGTVIDAEKVALR